MALNADKTVPEGVLTGPTTGRYCYICDEQDHEPYTHMQGAFWHHPASDGKYYLIRGKACGCASFFYGTRPCKHILYVRNLEAEGKTHDLSHNTWLRYEQARWPVDIRIEEL